MRPTSVFIIGCPRSGTTAVTRLLSLADNAEIHVEHRPRLRIESRQLLKGQLHDPPMVLREAKANFVREANSRGLVFGDKNPCYLPFIPYLFEVFDCRVIFVVRNGYDVVRSLMHFHESYSPDVFARNEDDASIPESPPESQLWDYSRLRPNPGEPYFDDWRALSRFEKCCWYWAKFCDTGLSLLMNAPQDRQMVLDMSKATADDVRDCYEFTGLTGFEPTKITDMLAQRINSVRDKTGGSAERVRFPGPEAWTADQRIAFRRLAQEMMEKLGYPI